MAACSAYGPSAPSSSSARARAARPRRISSWSQRPRSCFEQQDRLPRRPDPGPHARGLDLHQRHQPVDLGLLRRELGEDPTQPERVVAQRGADPVLAGGGRVALVEHQVDHAEHGREPGGQRLAARHLERHPRLGQGALGAHDSLGHRGLGHEERPGDLRRGEPAQQPERQCDSGVGREHRMAGREHEPQQVVADVVVERGVEISHRRLLLRLQLVAELLVLAVEHACGAAAGRSPRCLAVAMSHAPGLSGTPVAGHRSSAATRASCARSSARPRSPTMRVRPAISRADSMRQTASMARWISVSAPGGSVGMRGERIDIRSRLHGVPEEARDQGSRPTARRLLDTGLSRSRAPGYCRRGP